MSKKIIAVATVGIMLGAALLLLVPEGRSATSRIGALKAGCAQCMSHPEVCVDNGIYCAKQRTQEVCNCADHREQYNNPYYNCQGPEQQPCCQELYWSACQKVWDCEWDQEYGCQQDDEYYIRKGYSDCDDVPPCPPSH